MSGKKLLPQVPVYVTACSQHSARSVSTTNFHPAHSGKRCYATAHEDGRAKSSDGRPPRPPPVDPYHWPVAEPPRTVPTPYEILHIDPKAQYLKTARFYELVKLYHPDRHERVSTSSATPISKAVRLERYRLVVSAHALLSDPEKRRAYDRYGAGWAGAKSVIPAPDFTMSQEARDACMHNATWQDWENWYDRFNPPKPGDAPRKPQAPVFVSNVAFISIVGILAALAGIGQATRARETSKNYTLMVDAASNRAKGDVNHELLCAKELGYVAARSGVRCRSRAPGRDVDRIRRGRDRRRYVSTLITKDMSTANSPSAGLDIGHVRSRTRYCSKKGAP